MLAANNDHIWQRITNELARKRPLYMSDFDKQATGRVCKATSVMLEPAVNYLSGKHMLEKPHDTTWKQAYILLYQEYKHRIGEKFQVANIPVCQNSVV